MPDNNISHTDKIVPTQHNLSANERAIIESQKIAVLRRLFTILWHVKLRLQFTGWLQYIPLTIITLAFFLLAALARLSGGIQMANLFVFIGVILLMVLLFELVTIKFRIRPPERLPKRNDTMSVFDLMRERHSCRSFQTRKLTPADHKELMEYVRLHSESPTIGKSPIRFEYIAAPLTVWPTVNASEFLVAIAPIEYNRVAIIDVGRSLQKIVMDATRMGLATCWIGPGADHSSIEHHLGERYNPKEDHIICVCAIGYESWFIPIFLRIFNAQLHRRLPISSLFFADAQLIQPLNVEAYPFNQFGRNYEACQWAPSSYDGQTTRCVAVMEAQKNRNMGRPQLTRFDFYAVTESRYYAAVAVGIWCANWEIGCEALGMRGSFVVLPAKERLKDEETPPKLPNYDVSWVLDERI